MRLYATADTKNAQAPKRLGEFKETKDPGDQSEITNMVNELGPSSQGLNLEVPAGLEPSIAAVKARYPNL